MSSSSYKLEGELMLKMVILVLTVLASITCADGSVEAESRRSLLANGLALTPPMGWNSWNHFNCIINETVIKETADALVSTGLSKLGYHYVNIDDCWAEKNRDSKDIPSFLSPRTVRLVAIRAFSTRRMTMMLFAKEALILFVATTCFGIYSSICLNLSILLQGRKRHLFYDFPDRLADILLPLMGWWS